MKRSPELTPLSHDHHQALVAAMRLKRANDPPADAAAYLEFWRSHGARHFEIEEEILLPGWVAACADADRAHADRLAREHLTIRAETRRLERGDASAAQLRELGELLEAHVRFEERELFPLIETQLDDETIATLGAEIAAAEYQGTAESQGTGEGP